MRSFLMGASIVFGLILAAAIFLLDVFWPAISWNFNGVGNKPDGTYLLGTLPTALLHLPIVLAGCGFVMFGLIRNVRRRYPA
jgi:hypothetical protein